MRPSTRRSGSSATLRATPRSRRIRGGQARRLRAGRAWPESSPSITPCGWPSRGSGRPHGPRLDPVRRPAHVQVALADYLPQRCEVAIQLGCGVGKFLFGVVRWAHRGLTERTVQAETGLGSRLQPTGPELEAAPVGPSRLAEWRTPSGVTRVATIGPERGPNVRLSRRVQGHLHRGESVRRGLRAAKQTRHPCSHRLAPTGRERLPEFLGQVFQRGTDDVCGHSARPVGLSDGVIAAPPARLSKQEEPLGRGRSILKDRLCQAVPLSTSPAVPSCNVCGPKDSSAASFLGSRGTSAGAHRFLTRRVRHEVPLFVTPVRADDRTRGGTRRVLRLRSWGPPNVATPGHRWILGGLPRLGALSQVAATSAYHRQDFQ